MKGVGGSQFYGPNLFAERVVRVRKLLLQRIDRLGSPGNDHLVRAVDSRDDDIFVGSRLAMNNSRDTDVLFGVIVDANDGSIAGRVEAGSRLTERLSLEVDARFFTNLAPLNPLNVFKRDSYLGLRLNYNF